MRAGDKVCCIKTLTVEMTPKFTSKVFRETIFVNGIHYNIRQTDFETFVVVETNDNYPYTFFLYMQPPRLQLNSKSTHHYSIDLLPWWDFTEYFIDIKEERKQKINKLKCKNISNV